MIIIMMMMMMMMKKRDMNNEKKLTKPPKIYPKKLITTKINPCKTVLTKVVYVKIVPHLKCGPTLKKYFYSSNPQNPHKICTHKKP